ncbi:MAG: GNAT family N-acetyltransferase [Ktedonobacterales bacterium]|nr:GNAT family N-acetyltransferase [Ktedonobacterales bacterium]
MFPLRIRAATREDLPGVYAIWYAAEIEGTSTPPLARPVAAWITHVFEHGRMLVAEHAGTLVGFTALIERDGVAYLSDLFILQAHQSRHVGSALLQRVLPGRARVLCTCASREARALALYVRAGMRPRWPNIWLRGHADALGALPAGNIRAVEAAADDPALLTWDAEIGGRHRPEDQAYWLRRTDAVPLWFQRDGRTVGYGYAQMRSDEALWHPDAATLGPIGARTAENAAGCVLAAVAWARERAAVLRLSLPGPHPALAALLAAHFHITYVETFRSSADTPFFDPQLYATSGAVL